MTKDKSLNIYQKLIEVRKRVTYLQKDASGYNYKYADEDSILSAIRPEIDRLALFLEFEMSELTPVNDKIVQATFVFTWVNAEKPDERIEKRLSLQCPLGDTQKIGGLCTYANRYFLYKFFNVPTGELGPDSRTTISRDQLNVIETLINGYDDIRKLMITRLGDLSKLTVDRFEPTVQWIEREVAKKEASNEG